MSKRKPKKKPPPKRPRGRPSEYTSAKADQVIKFFEEGGTRHGLDKVKTLPSWPAFKRWMEKHPELRSRYERAQRDQAHSLLDEALNELRDCTEENAKSVRVKVDGLTRIAEKKNPKGLGRHTKQEVSGPEGGPVRMSVDDLDVSKLDDETITKLLDRLEQRKRT